MSLTPDQISTVLDVIEDIARAVVAEDQNTDPDYGGQTFYARSRATEKLEKAFGAPEPEPKDPHYPCPICGPGPKS